MKRRKTEKGKAVTQVVKGLRILANFNPEDRRIILHAAGMQLRSEGYYELFQLVSPFAAKELAHMD